MYKLCTLCSIYSNYVCMFCKCFAKVLQRYYSHNDGCCVDVETLRFWVGTWNINGGKQFRSIAHKHRGEGIEDWLLDIARLTIERHPEPSEVCYLPALLNDHSASSSVRSQKSQGPSGRGLERGFDVYVVGFEEMVDLNASNIFNTSAVNQREWGAYLYKLLNRANLNRFADAQPSSGSAASGSGGGGGEVEEFVLIATEQLVGICLFIFVRSTLAPYIRDVQLDQVKTGLMGAAGNKGKSSFILVMAVSFLLP